VPHDLSPLPWDIANLSAKANSANRAHQVASDSPTHVYVPSLPQSGEFQEKYTVPVGATALGLAAASLPLMYTLGKKKRKDSPAEAVATPRDLEAGERAVERAVSTERAGSAPADAPATPTQSAADAAANAAANAAENERQIALPLSSDRRFSTMLSNVATGVWNQTDLYTGLNTGDDKEFRERMMHPPPGQMSLPQLKEQLSNWAKDIAELDLPADLKKHFRDSINDTRAAIDSLIKNTNPWKRGAKLVAQAILSTPLPIVLPLFAVPIERQQMCVIIASYVKTTMLRGGLGMRATADDAAIANLYLNRDYANVIQSIALSLNLFSETSWIADNPAYSIGAATASAVALAYTFYPGQVTSLPRRTVRAVRQVASFITGNGLLPPDQRAVKVGGIDTAGVSGANKEKLHALGGKVLAVRTELALQQRYAKAAGKILTDTADWQFGQVLKGYYNLARELDSFTALPGATRGKVHDPDRIAKLALASLSGAICIGVTAMFYQNKITAVDLGVDALFNIYNGFNQALDPNVSWQQSLETFKNWTSLSLVMAPMQAGNLLAGNPVEQSNQNMLIGASALTAANLLVAGPFGALVNLVVGKALARAKRDVPTQAPPLEMADVAPPVDAITPGVDSIPAGADSIPAGALRVLVSTPEDALTSKRSR